ncbi:uncharacterized protein Z520_05919 [Fonsecaea multimorphosa CBS 102226]|uniref:GIY-YIG domain-containing protein n=1 Tax=Fonsecaea multimorphosa CBS 102226 TaxID=1442371 RepID=A0A0D2KPG9_9EURO|nr:uncharacterized protein Z520_05919 [Fonsecaea multimorphosa CBS 102226]KIX98618.1 hypothetical protein Z520_05919 [Fonsecaea multimorphosa CBS 102226]OAL24808.1 hypothetical protein AYO22_05597 [Fonsecaea multimorphosa]
MDIKPIPAFYCCYLLRSTVRHSSLYIGSSPDPARRLAQHNGRVQGGAVRTSRATLRPWEMACIVAGFPSNIAALQFEWAWHNAHLTRHISPEQRLSFATTRTKTSRTGKVTKRPGRPRTSMIDKLSNLHLLLRAPYFSKWPLQVRFFSEDVYRSWSTWCGRVDTQIRPEIRVHFDPAEPRAQPPEEVEFTSAQPQPVQRKRKADLIGKGGVEGVDPTYARLKSVFEKSQFLLDEDDEQKCSVCAEVIDLRKSIFVVCHTHDCPGMSHIRCLADKSLNETQSALSMVPESATCPSCHQEHAWLELMQQVTLRNRGEKEVKKLMGKKSKTTASAAAEMMETESEEEDGPSESEEEEALTARRVVAEEAELSSDDGGDDEDRMSLASVDSFTSMASNVSSGLAVKPPAGTEEPKRLQIVIEDSEDEG